MRRLALLLALPLSAAAQQPGAVVQVEYTNPGMAPSHWTLVLHANGTGSFHTKYATVVGNDAQAIEIPPIDRSLQVSEAFAERVFQVAKSRKVLTNECESHLKVAFQGWKTIRYQGQGQLGSCTFNYSRDKQIQELGESFVAVAATLMEGARLELVRQYDPLGLDKEVGFLVEGSADGRLQQLCTIRAILESLEQDPAVMEMVRKRVRVLLARAER